MFAAFFTRRPNLLICILLDLIGITTYFVPGLTEWGDIIWAPLSAYLFLKLFGGVGGILGGGFSFLEEILPFTDIIPTFTIAWLIQNNQTKNLNNPFRKTEVETEDAEVIEIK